MAFLKYNGVGITALAAAIPRQVIDNYKYTQYFSEDQVKQIVDKVILAAPLRGCKDLFK